MKYFIILMLFITSTTFAQNVVEGNATVKKVNWQDDKIIDEIQYQGITKFAINETDSIILLGNETLNIKEIIASDSIVTYITNKPDKEFVYDRDVTLTQKNIAWRSHGLETWFMYVLIGNKNEFEF